MKFSLPMTRLIILLFFSCFAFIGFSQSTQDLDDYGASVEQGLVKYTMVEKQKTETGSKQFFYEGRELKLVRVLVADHGILKKVDWYYVENKLILAETTWKSDLKGDVVFHEKYYFSKGKMFAWLNFENQFEKPESELFKSTGQDILRTAARWIEEAKAAKK